MSSEKSFLMMFNDIESPTNIIYGANGTAMLSTSGEQQYDKFLDVFSSSTRIDSTKMDTSSFDKDSFLAKLDACNVSGNVDPLFVALGFYLRDIKEKGERTLFHLFFIKLWENNLELSKKLLKFIVGSDDSEYFGCWKDLHQILVLAKDSLSAVSYATMYDFFQVFEGTQLESDWNNFISYTVEKNEQRPHISLCTKWSVSSDKHFDSKLSYNDKSYIANFCQNNADRLIRMSDSARLANIEKFSECKKLKSSNFIGLQKTLRKVKSTLNEFIDTPEQKMCSGHWSELNPSHIPARNMTKHRRAFHNEKAVHDRKSDNYDIYTYAYGDRIEPDVFESIDAELKQLVRHVTNSDFMERITQFKLVNSEALTNPSLAKAVDRVLCRFKVINTTTNTSKVIHGARSDINDLVIAALNMSGSKSYDPTKINEWGQLHPERALIHRQVEDKIQEISSAIDKIIAESTISESDEKKVRINLKKVIGLYDVSDSMLSGTGSISPINVCIGMAYVIGRLTSKPDSPACGITFHESPSLFKIPQNMDFVSAIHHIKCQPWGRSTDFQSAFRLLLDYAVKEKLGPDDMPEAMFVFSDMQFDVASGRSNRWETMFGTLKREFNAKGYELPMLVFWNLNGNYAGQSVKSDTQGVVMISGYDPAIFKTIVECGSLCTRDSSGKISGITPMEMMLSALQRDKYQPILEEVRMFYRQQEDEDELFVQESSKKHMTTSASV